MATSVWKGHLTFGLVSFPIKLCVAARSETISFNQLHKTDHSRIKQVTFCQAEDKPVSRGELVKGYEYEKDRYVVIDEDEIEKIAPKTAKIMEIVEFVKSSEVDPVYYESSFYLLPDEAGERPYTLLVEALRRSGYTAIAKMTKQNREYVVMIRPGKHGLILHTMYYADEVRAMDEFRTDTSLVKDKELEMATMLVETLAGPFEPAKYRDEYREKLRGLIDAKIKGEQILEAPAAQPPAPVIDIMEALRNSLAKLKKPPVSDVAAQPGTSQAAPAATGARRRRKANAG